MKSFIKIIATFAFLFFVGSASAQNWTLSGTNIYNNNSGYVGIGISSPTKDLHVYDASGSCDLFVERPYNEAADAKIGRLRVSNPTSGDLFNISLRKNSGVYEMIQSAKDGSGTWYEFIYFNYSTQKYEIRGGIGTTEYLNNGNVLFNNTGGVGIGTSNIPTGYALAIDGKVIAEELEIQLSGSWPDYVFCEDYELRSLSDLEQFIKTNKHLPELPSANEVENNNINVGEMNALLLKKIEELTLYVIDIKKENEVLKDRISKLEN